MSEMNDLRDQVKRLVAVNEATVAAVRSLGEVARHAIGVATISAMALNEVLSALREGRSVTSEKAAALQAAIAEKLQAMDTFIDNQLG